MRIKRVLGGFLLVIAISTFVYLLIFCRKKEEVHFKQECGRITEKIIAQRRENIYVNVAFPSGNETKSYPIREYFNHNIGDVVCTEKLTLEGKNLEDRIIFFMVTFSISFFCAMYLLASNELEEK